jgi:hypothetical protein
MDDGSIGLMDGRVTCLCWQIKGAYTCDDKLFHSPLALMERLTVRSGWRSTLLDLLQVMPHTKQIKT